MTLHRQGSDASLSPILTPRTADLISHNGKLLIEWAEKHGSPFHLVSPEALGENVDALAGLLAQNGINHALYYGAKVNKSPGLMHAALDAGIGVDVSSLYELQDALALGAAGERIVATGPAKTGAFHDALIACKALISIDSPEELDDLSARLPEDGEPQPVLLRLRPGSQAGSRFGMDADDVRLCLSVIVADSRLRFDGLHFHLSGYRWETRAVAIREASRLISEARAIGLTPRMIDIGGGLPIRYVDASAYQAHIKRQRAADYRNRKLPSSFYPYGGEISAADWLGCLLAAELDDGRSIANYFREENLSLALEPGRALADQAAVSVFRISRVKALGPDTAVIFVEGSSFSACETWFASEFLIDPIIVPVAAYTPADTPIKAYLAGHSCLDEDVLTNRWLDFPAVPRAGDLLVYANTAGYQMDLLENEFHRHPMPKRLRVHHDADGTPLLTLDDLEMYL
ncbi:Y4yA family PLP-dependent enzyme [Agrobacterium rhizogenes]|uniref:Y4yA family PLP-dependent enzyme n=1 Tax=Rhizobium rhizogenes TaxID=359 RepID=UPI0015736362|nr:Y4yA family PLP-dependent enzyme [Rhizobium rhizogenes]NTG51605.1 Y4yA family PLP-dependent enzyme [Rhizobium rhizogenes]